MKLLKEMKDNVIASGILLSIMIGLLIFYSGLFLVFFKLLLKTINLI